MQGALVVPLIPFNMGLTNLVTPPPHACMKGALVMPLMAQGFNMGLIKFNLITARKPAANGI